MTYPKLLTGLVACTFLGACSSQQSDTSGNLPIIEVETAFRNPSELSLTDLGEKMTYIPLETLDNSLVKLGSQSRMIVTDQYIFVGDGQTPILCFDRSTGKFLRNIGSIGQGPVEYNNSTDMEVDAEAKRIYVRKTLSSYQCYDFEGNFLHSLTLPDTHFMMGSHYFTKNKAYAYCNVAGEGTTSQAYAYQVPEGTCTDSLGLNGMEFKKQKAVMPLMGTETFGGRFFMVEHEDGTWTSGNRVNSTYQGVNGNLYHKDLFCDTLFLMNGLHREKPVATFQLGSLGGYGRYETTSNIEGKYILPRVLCNGEQIYFTLFTGLYDIQGIIRKAQSEGIHLSCGIYNLRNGEVKVQKEELGFKHPDEAMPKGYVNTLSTDGQWVVAYQTEDLIEARENIPTEQQPDWLKNLKDDDNPVILLIEP